MGTGNPNPHARTDWAPFDEMLKAGYSEGKSAGTLAQEINALGGQTVTRNSVIGRIHRLGLTGSARAKASAPAPRLARSAPSAPRVIEPKRGTSRAGMLTPSEFPQHGAPSVAEAPLPPERKIAAAPPPPGADSTCNWPIGDPLRPGFSFCGRPSTRDDRGRCYCPEHRAIAFTTPPAKSPRTANELARSLRRYIA